MTDEQGAEVFRDVRLEVWELIKGERDRQDRKWGWLGTPGSIIPEGTLDQRLAVLAEEFGEVAKVVNGIRHQEAGGNRDHLHQELIQVAAVALAWVEADLEYEQSYTWETVPLKFLVHGRGVVIKKEELANGRIMVTFNRLPCCGGIPVEAPAWEPGCNEWSEAVDRFDPVPIYLNPKTGALIYAKGVRAPRLFDR